MAFSLLSEVPSEDDQLAWSCSLCLEALKHPKLLPCAHTFCEACLEELLQHQSSSKAFLCPNCREKIAVPLGGISAFKDNPYIESAKPKRVRKNPLCQNHKEAREIELYCRQCNACICLKCKLEEHFNHDTENVQETASRFRAKLEIEKKGLESDIENLKIHNEIFRKEQEAVRDKTNAVKSDIYRRFQMMESVADRCRDEALFSLDSATVSIISKLSYDVTEMGTILEELTKRQKRLDKSIKSEEGSVLLLTAHDIYSDADRLNEGLQKTLTKSISSLSRPVLHYSASSDLTLRSEQEFLGQVVRVDLDNSAPVVFVKKIFQCLESYSSHDVYSIYPRADDSVWIAYDPPGDGSEVKQPNQIDMNGKVIHTENAVSGRTNFLHTEQGMGLMVTQKPDSFSTYAKSRKLFKLKNDLKGKGVVREFLVKTEHPLRTLTFAEFSLKCGPHRAFDVDDKELLFVVVEEGQAPESQRKVHLYDNPGEARAATPIATYLPPSQPFQPSDVCFCRLNERQVLMVADEANDAIHVVSADWGTLRFMRYLAPGCPLILQPTALNTDITGRLWIGCRNGDILVCEPTSVS